MMKKLLLCIMGAFLLLGFAGCSSDDEDVDSQGSLYNTWLLVSYGSETNEVLKEAAGYYYIISFNPDGTYTGNIYGNYMYGEYKCNNNQITINQPGTTKALYEGADSDQFFLEHISDVYTYTVSGTELRLYYSETQFFKFRIKK